MKITIDDYVFTSTHEFYRGVIQLSANIGSSSTSLIYFSVTPHINFEDFSENQEIFEKLLTEFYKQPKEFMDHWSCRMSANEINNWISNTRLWGMEFRQSENGASGLWILFYMNDDNKELKQLSIDFKNNFK